MTKIHSLNKLDAVWEMAEKIFADASAITGSSDPVRAKKFRITLLDFLSAVRKGWMRKRYAMLRSENQARLSNLLQELHRLDLEVVNHILLMERGGDLLIGLRKIEAPLRISEEETYVSPLDISSWFYSSRLINELAQTDAPS